MVEVDLRNSFVQLELQHALFLETISFRGKTVIYLPSNEHKIVLCAARPHFLETASDEFNVLILTG